MRKIVAMMFFLLVLSGCEEIENPPIDENPDEVIVDTTAPTISLFGDTEVTMKVGQEYADLGASALDDSGVAHVVTIGLDELNTSEPGHHYLYYYAYDDAGNQSEILQRTIRIEYPEPGIISAMTYESYDFLAVSTMTIDMNHVLDELTLSIYDGDILLETVEVTSSEFSYVFENLETNGTYEVHIDGYYYPLPWEDPVPFSKTSLSVGTYRTIKESWRDDINNDIVFDLLEQMVYLPFDSSTDNYAKEMVLQLSRVGEHLLNILSEQEQWYVLVDGKITQVPEYQILAGVPINDGTGDTIDDRPAICCQPTVVKINYHGTSINLMLQMTGSMLDALYFGYIPDPDGFLIMYYPISMTDYWMDIYNAEAETMFPNSRYSDNEYDFFIEAFAYYYFSDLSNQELADNAPRAYAFFRDMEAIRNGDIPIEWWNTPE